MPPHLLRFFEYATGQRIEITHGDLTLEAVDAIVNAANAHLRHGGGIAGAIVQRGGWEIQRESDEWVRRFGPVSHARPAYTGAGTLPCRYVIHAVGPVWGEGDEDLKLAAAVRGSLDLAANLDLDSVALPAISTGIFGFPKDRAAKIIISQITRYFDENNPRLRLLRVVLFDQPTEEAFLQQWDEYEFP